MKKFTLLLLTLFLTFNISTYAQISNPVIYVDDDATGESDGSSWEDAYTDLQDALNDADSTDGLDEIWVAEGVYTPMSNNLDESHAFYDDPRAKFYHSSDNVLIYGGFDGTESSFNERSNLFDSTIISGDVGYEDYSGDNLYSLYKLRASGGNLGIDNFDLNGFVIKNFRSSGELGFFIGLYSLDQINNVSFKNLAFSNIQQSNINVIDVDVNWGEGILNRIKINSLNIDQSSISNGSFIYSNSPLFLNQLTSHKVNGENYKVVDGSGVFKNLIINLTSNNKRNGGIYIYGSHIKNCKIKTEKQGWVYENDATGIFIKGGDNIIENCNFEGLNYAIKFEDQTSSSVNVNNSHFSKNGFSFETYWNPDTLYVNNSSFFNSWTSLSLNNDEAVVTNSKFIIGKNQRAVTLTDNSNFESINNTFFGNSEYGERYFDNHNGIILVFGDQLSTSKLKNTIIFSKKNFEQNLNDHFIGNQNGYDIQVFTKNSSLPFIKEYIYNAGGNLVGVDPQFADTSENNLDLRLKGSSPLIDAGDNSELPQDFADLDNDGNTSETIPYDFAGNQRIQDVGNGSIVDIGAYESDGSPLPVELTSFTYKIDGSDIELNWKTASETNNAGFEIQQNGERIGYVNGSGTTNVEQSYSFTVKNLEAGEYTFRLKQVDYDGSFAYSDELEIQITPESALEVSNVFPSPASNQINLNVASQYEISNQSIVIYNVLGQEVYNDILNVNRNRSERVRLNVSGLSSGVYFVRFQVKNETVTRKFIKR